MIDQEIKCPCGDREYMEEHNCEKTDCDKCCPLALQETINSQQEELEEARIGVKSYKGKYESATETARELKLVIAEKQAEIEALTGNLRFVRGTAERQRVEIERLSNSAKQWEDTAKDLFIGKQTAKAEAIKEFMEKLKDLSYESDLYDRNERWVQAVTVREIDETYKEMVGEQG